MNTLGRLGELYGLGPATLAGLGQKADMPVDPSWTQGTPAGPPAPMPVDPSLAHSAPSDPNAPSALFSRPMGEIAPAQGAAMARSMTAQERAPADTPTPSPAVSMSPSQASVTIPAHESKTTREYESVGGMTPENAEAYAMHRDAQLGYNQAAAGNEMRNNDIMSRAMQETGAAIKSEQLMDQHRKYLIQQNLEREKFVRDNQAQVQAAALDASQKVDPDDIWKGNTFGRVLAAISMGLGSFGASLTHTENSAANIIQGAIRDNIDAQKTNIANAKGRLGELRNARIDKIAALDDDTDRHGALTLLYVDQAKQMAMDWAKKNGLDPNAPAMMKQMAMLDGMAADTIKDIDANANGKVTQKQAYKWHEEQTTGGVATTKREGNLVTSADGTTYKFDSDKSAETARAKLQAYGDVQLLTNKILSIRKDTMKLDPLMDRQKYENNILALKKLDDDRMNAEATASGQGVVTKEDVKRNEDVGLSATAGLGTFKGVGRLLGTSYEAANSAYETLVKTNSDRQQAYLQAASPEVYKRDYGKDSQGNLVPTGSYTGQDAKPQQALIPRGAVPMDGKPRANVAGAPDRETTPYAPVRNGVVNVKREPAKK